VNLNEVGANGIKLEGGIRAAGKSPAVALRGLRHAPETVQLEALKGKHTPSKDSLVP